MSSLTKFWAKPEAFAEKPYSDVHQYLNDANRSSTIFPVLTPARGKSYLSFLNYWGLKHGNFVIMVITLRNEDGSVRAIEWEPIIDVRSYSFELGKYFACHEEVLFCGSVEVEFFSKEEPRFTFPGVSIIYEGDEGSSVVHSCIRRYNPGEEVHDYALGLPQTGFDVVVNSETQNYICFAGGQAASYSFKLSLQYQHRLHEVEFSLANRKNQLHVLNIEDYFEKLNINGVCKLTIDHNLDVYPRFYCGTYRQEDIPTITHSFFDTSLFLDAKADDEKSKFACVREKDEGHYDSVIMFPMLGAGVETQIISYGQSMGFEGEVDLRFFDNQGCELYRLTEVPRMGENWSDWQLFDPINEFLGKGLEGSPSAILVGFRASDGLFPARFKVGLNIFKKGRVGTNICVGPTSQDGSLFQKPFSPRWFAIGGRSNFVATLHNPSFQTSCEVQAPNNLEIRIFNNFGESYEKRFMVNKNGSIFLDVSKDQNLSRFLDGETGWCLAQSDGFLLDGYFFSTKGDILGGDHAF